MKPEMTECDRKLVTQPSLKMPTMVYRQPARNATCTVRDASQPRLAVGHAVLPRQPLQSSPTFTHHDKLRNEVLCVPQPAALSTSSTIL